MEIDVVSKFRQLLLYSCELVTKLSWFWKIPPCKITQSSRYFSFNILPNGKKTLPNDNTTLPNDNTILPNDNSILPNKNYSFSTKK